MEELRFQGKEKSSTVEGTAAPGVEDAFTDPRNQGCQEARRATLTHQSQDCGGHGTARQCSQKKKKGAPLASLSWLFSPSSRARPGIPTGSCKDQSLHWEFEGDRGREREQMAASVMLLQPRREGITTLASHTRSPRLRAVAELARVPKPAA